MFDVWICRHCVLRDICMVEAIKIIWTWKQNSAIMLSWFPMILCFVFCSFTMIFFKFVMIHLWFSMSLLGVFYFTFFGSPWFFEVFYKLLFCLLWHILWFSMILFCFCNDTFLLKLLLLLTLHSEWQPCLMNFSRLT